MGHILVVDDDALVGDVIRVSLAAEHDVVVTTAASEVLQRTCTRSSSPSIRPRRAGWSS